ncbi:MAG: hypothetical protein VR72_02115 [Clostridiaceae bacterium BRH_c20a]|nr:MAG: hypothetical protein VR72_02115 [Clostridiaceae bacterium BRH_c20a]
MGYSKFQYVLLTVMAEIGYLYPLYYLIAVGLETPSMAIIPIWIVAIIAISSVLVNKILYNKKMRILTKIIVYALIVGAIILWLVWLPLLFSLEDGLKSLLQKWNLVLLVLWIWTRTMLITRKIPNYSVAVSRFELGLALIFIIFLLDSLLATSISNGIFSLILFFLCSAGTLSLTKWEEERLASSWSGLVFAAIVLIPLALTVSLLLPFMKHVAGIIYKIATPVLIFARDILARILIFLFKRTNLIRDRGTSLPAVNNTQDSLTYKAGVMPMWLEYIFRIIGWAIIGVILIIVALLILYLIKKILLKLLKVENANQKGKHVEENFTSWLKSILNSFREYLVKVGVFILIFLPHKISVFESYNALLYWGAFRKYPREKQETPYEYCQRLSKHFPQQKINLKVITDCYVAYKYGNKNPGQETYKQLKNSLRELYLSGLLKLC